jgi:hypothetical protein
MITFWLVVALQVGGGGWQVMEDVEQPDLVACLSAVAERVQRFEAGHIVGEDRKPLNEEFEIAVTCSMHHSRTDPA